ncbi:TlpA disulfide reductase family protein [Fulvivirgaceae bacterium BMA10]|uniref:TlpA disulfide reductase family protein n=1 Tax=Splendidivirga corallicola TaxID=3051826 RepID=A0ABT8KLH9_9BACT|nr:TlpA disulfide reductase family protein [Fulvivirgaceae bacterium BMA10]
MKFYTRLFALGIFLLFLSNETRSQEVTALKLNELQAMMDKPSDKVKVFNFWATWCKPCIKELPHFEKLNKEHKNVEVFLVSMDFIEDLDKKVKNFVQKKQLKSKVLLLNETDQDQFINAISSKWSGAIPATLIVNTNTGQKDFYEQEFNEEELNQLIKRYIN